MREIRSINFVGIKGVGMTPLAIIAKESVHVTIKPSGIFATITPIAKIIF